MLLAQQPAPDAPRHQQLLWRFRHLWPLFSVGAGLASFLLIERRDGMARWLAGFLLAGWLLILAEGAAGRWLGRRQPRWAQASPWLMRFLTQAIHQETFFFTLPFLLHTTTWTSPQAAFTLAVAVAALVSSWDPVYYGRIAPRPGAYLAFHAFAVYVAMLVLLPMLLHLTTHETLTWSAAAIALLAVPSLAQALPPRRLRDWGRPLLLALTLGAGAWLLRPWIPPATLWISRAAISTQLDVAGKEPGPALERIDVDTLRAQGLYAYSAIRAPRGLREQVFHRWLQEGREIDRIALPIEGGREQGYRAWSHKQGFPEDPRGRWCVEIVTESGQLIGLVRFSVE